MTPKEKAEELVHRMELYTGNDIAKQCALIAVDEILKRNQPIQGHFWDYWEQVKKEIELL